MNDLNGLLVYTIILIILFAPIYGLLGFALYPLIAETELIINYIQEISTSTIMAIVGQISTTANCGL